MGRKNRWQLVEHAGNATPYGMQRVLSWAVWDADQVRDDLQDYVAERLGAPDGVLIVDDTDFIRKGTVSTGVQRQYSGTAGPTENCHIGVFAVYASARGRALVDRELYLPSPGSRTGSGAGPRGSLVLRALSSALPMAWVTADAAYGQEWRFRRMLEELA